MSVYWTTASGEKIPYDQLSDEHLKNIIRDGYRNPNILLEAKNRGFIVPKRPVDKLNYLEIMQYVEIFASCALAGNEYAEKMFYMWDKGEEARFYFHLNRYLVSTNKQRTRKK